MSITSSNFKFSRIRSFTLIWTMQSRFLCVFRKSHVDSPLQMQTKWFVWLSDLSRDQPTGFDYFWTLCSWQGWKYAKRWRRHSANYQIIGLGSEVFVSTNFPLSRAFRRAPSLPWSSCPPRASTSCQYWTMTSCPSCPSQGPVLMLVLMPCLKKLWKY